MSAAHRGLFVAKAQIAEWPILGYIIASAGTIFIARERARDSLSALSQMERAIHGGRRVLFFPEGTTSPGDRVRRFHTSLFAAACRLGVPVQPVALFYEDLVDPRSRIARSRSSVTRTSSGTSGRCSPSPRSGSGSPTSSR